MRLLKVLAAGFMLSTVMTTPVEAAPLVAVLFGPAFAATIGGQLLGALFGLGASWLFSSVVGALFPQQQPNLNQDTTGTSPQEVEYGERVSRGGIFGTTLVGGHLVHLNEYNDAKVLQYVAVVGDAWHTGLESVYINGRQYSITEVAVGSNNEHKRYTVDDFGSLIDLRFHDGRPGQAADTNLVAQTPGWDATRTFSGMAYVVAEITSDRSKFNGIPELGFVPIGMRCYDLRKDTTAGGSGSHRFNDPTTWEYTENPAVMAYHFLRGFYFNGKRVLGVGLSPARINADTFITAANICDQTVLDPNNVARPRYTCHMAFKDTDQFAAVLDRLCASMGGYHTEIQGQIAIFAGAPKVSVKTITDDDLVRDEQVVFNPGRPGEMLITGVQGTYTHSTEYTPTPYTAIEPSAFLSDNWYPHVAELNFKEVKNSHQAYLLAQQYLYKNRKQASASICLDIKDLIIQVNDWIVWNSTGVRGNRTYEVVNCRYDLGSWRMYLQLQETGTDIYDDNATPEDVVEPVRTRPVTSYLTSVSNFDIGPIQLQGESGETIPALEFTYDPILDPAIEGIEIHYRVADEGSGPGPEFKVIDRTPADGLFRVTQGVTPGKIHEAYAVIIAMPGRDVDEKDWTDAVQALFPTSGLTAVVEISDGSITLIKLQQELQNIVGLISGGGPSSVWSRIQFLEEEIERQANAAYTNNTTYARETTLLKRSTSSSIAAIATERQVRATADAALAEQITEVAAGVGNLLASGLLQFTAEVDGGGGTGVAQISAKVRVENEDDFSEAAMIMTAEQDGMGGNTSYIAFIADKFFILNPDMDAAEQPFTFADGVLTLNEIRFNRLRSIAMADVNTPIIDIDGTTGALSITVAE